MKIEYSSVMLSSLFAGLLPPCHHSPDRISLCRTTREQSAVHHPQALLIPQNRSPGDHRQCWRFVHVTYLVEDGKCYGKLEPVKLLILLILLGCPLSIVLMYLYDKLYIIYFSIHQIFVEMWLNQQPREASQYTFTRHVTVSS